MPDSVSDPELLLPLKDPGLLAELDALARRHGAASGLGMKLLSYLGGSAEGLLKKLPAPVRDGLEGATARALEGAFTAAARSRGILSDRSDWVNTAIATAMGAAGGLGGIPSALGELPFTVTMLLRAIQGIAADHGFDPASEETRMECLRVFASSGPLGSDDAQDMSFLATRMTVTGRGLQGLIAKVAPRLSAVLGQKIAAQAAPVFGAIAGAGVNYAYTSYYQEIARVHFGLKALARARGIDEGLLREELIARIRRGV